MRYGESFSLHEQADSVVIYLNSSASDPMAIRRRLDELKKFLCASSMTDW